MILGNLKMVHAISRHYSQPAEMGRFLRRVANQLAARSRAALAAGGKLWEQPKPQLINCMGAVGRLHAAFVVRVAGRKRLCNCGVGAMGAAEVLHGCCRPVLRPRQ